MNSRTTEVIDVEDPTARRSSRAEVAVWVTWTAILLLMVRSHEMWRDELQAWAIARDSTWPWELITNTAYEGHPPGWHLLLWPVSLLTRSPVAVQLVSVACVSGASWLVLRHLPYTLAVRVLLLFGYFPLFEMGVLARSYSLLFLLVIGVLVLADRETLPLMPTVALLGAMALTLVLAIPLAGALAVAIAIRHREISGRRLLAAGAVLGALMLLSVRLARPPRRDGRRLFVDAADTDRIRSVLTGPIRIVVPWFQQQGDFWGNFVTSELRSDERWFGVAVLLVGIVVLRRWHAALAVWTIGAVGYLGATQTFALPMEPRQLTILWLTLVAAVWTAASEAVRRRAITVPPESGSLDVADVGGSVGRGINGWVVRSIGTAALIAGAVGVVWPIGTDIRHPFSGAEGAATWIREHSETSPAVYCASEVPACSSVAIRLDEPAYQSSDGEPFTFVVWRSGWGRRVPPDLVAGDSRRLAEQLGRRVVVVAHRSDFPRGCDVGWVSPPTIVPTELLVVCFADQLPLPNNPMG